MIWSGLYPVSLCMTIVRWASLCSELRWIPESIERGVPKLFEMSLWPISFVQSQESSKAHWNERHAARYLTPVVFDEQAYMQRRSAWWRMQLELPWCHMQESSIYSVAYCLSETIRSFLFLLPSISVWCTLFSGHLELCPDLHCHGFVFLASSPNFALSYELKSEGSQFTNSCHGIERDCLFSGYPVSWKCAVLKFVPYFWGQACSTALPPIAIMM